MPSEEYIKKYKHKTWVRSSDEIQKPFRASSRYKVPIDLVAKPAVKPFLDHSMLDEKSATIWKFICNER